MVNNAYYRLLWAVFGTIVMWVSTQDHGGPTQVKMDVIIGLLCYFIAGQKP